MVTMPMLTGAIQSFKAYQELTAPDIDYDILNLQAEDKDLRAEAIKNQVEEEANFMRAEFIEAVGAFKYGAARRGVKVGEGNVSQNIEMSSKAMGKDIQKMRGMAEFKAGQLRAEGRRLRIGARGVREIGRAEKIAAGAESIGKAAAAFRKGFGSQAGEKKASTDIAERGLITIDTKKRKPMKKKKIGLMTDYSSQITGIPTPSQGGPGVAGTWKTRKTARSGGIYRPIQLTSVSSREAF